MPMRWWLQTSPPYLMGVDNGSVTGMDFSDLLADEPDLWMVHWQEGRGEIERIEFDANNVASNLNGLREETIDITPYVPLFQQFMELMKPKNLLLNQAKKIQVDLIKQIYEVQRQAPFHYPVAAGDYWWDASDATLYSSLIPTIQNTISSVNGIATSVNTLAAQINARIADIINASIVVVGNEITRQVNATVVYYTNINIVAGYHTNSIALSTEVTNNITSKGTSLSQFLDNTVLGISTFGSGNTVNCKLQQTVFTIAGDPYNMAAPGLGGGIAHSNITFGDISAYALADIPTIAPGTMSQVTHVDATNIPPVAGGNVQWIPIGSTAPVPVTPPEARAIMQGITDRTNQLTLIKNQKIAEVNALTDLDAVIAYDVMADWPDMSLPPGYKLEPSGMTSGGATVVGTPPPPTTGVPEAPSDNVTYGRRNQVWNPALALSGDILDGGTF